MNNAGLGFFKPQESIQAACNFLINTDTDLICKVL